MVMKLYYGGFGDYMEFVVADSEEQAILKVGIKINAPFLPIKVTEIQNIDGYHIRIDGWDVSPITTFAENVVEAEEVEITVEKTLRHCKKCDFTCDNQGVLMKHYAEKHPKGD